MATEPIRYRCPNGHNWWTEESESPLVNIKCSICSVTAMRLHEGKPDPHWQVEPVREIAGHVRPPGAKP